MENENSTIVKDFVELLSSSDDLSRTRACRTLIAMGKAAVPFLVEALKFPDDLGRWEAAKALSEIGDPAAAPALVHALGDDEFEVRWRAAEGLARMGVAGLKPLLHALIEDSNSVLLRDGAHHVFHKIARGELGKYIVPVLMALESTLPSVKVPKSALSALEGLERFEKTHEEEGAASLKEFAAPGPNRPGDLQPQSRVRRYAKTLRHQAPELPQSQAS